MSEKKPDGFKGAYVAYRGSRWHGNIAANMEPELVRSFYSDFAGCDIRYVNTRDEFRKLMEELDI